MSDLFTMAPVFNLRIGEDIIPLDLNAFRLERCTLRQDEIPVDVQNETGWDRWLWLTSAMTWIVIPRSEFLSESAAREDVELIVTGIRLLKDAPVWVPIMWTGEREHGQDDPVLEAPVSYSAERWLAAEESGLPVYRYDECTCEIGPREVRKLKELLRQLQALPPGHRRLAIALKRFNMALDRGSREDGIIDLCIALEAAIGIDLAVPNKGEQLDVRVQRLLGRLGQDLDTRSIADHYWVRNQIVHGSSAPFDAEETFTGLASAARRTIREVIRQPSLFDE